MLRSSASAGPRKPCRGGPSPQDRSCGGPIWIKMLGGSKFRLRQDFCRGKNACGRGPPRQKNPPGGPGGSEFKLIRRSSASAGPRKPCRGGPSPQDRSCGGPIWIKMLGGSKFRLRQDFCRGKNACGRGPPRQKNPPGGPGGSEFKLIRRSSASAGPRKPCRGGPRRGPSHARCHGWHRG